jgi:hypothetical protein
MGAIPSVGQHTEKILAELGITLWPVALTTAKKPNA